MNSNFNLTVKACSMALNWLDHIDSAEIKKDADALETKLCRLLNRAEDAFEVLPVNNTIGVFGASQSGKSYLVSTLASEHNNLSTIWGDQEIIFGSHLNPEGGDVEATGVVTRFTHDVVQGCKRFPAEVRIFKEIDIVKILLNSFFNDLSLNASFMAEHDANLKPAAFKKFVASLNDCLLPDDNGLVSKADIVSLADYSRAHAINFLSEQDADGEFWLAFRDLAPRLNFKGRARLYSLLWGRISVFDLLFAAVGSELEKLGGKNTVYVGLDAFVEKDGSKLKQRAGGTLLDVQCLKRLLRPKELEQIEVSLDKEGANRVSLNYPSLAAIAKELLFPLPAGSSLDSFNVLDFPGARSRKEGDLSAWRKNDGEIPIEPIANEADSGSDFFRRGKVGYLIDLYCSRREIDILLCCIAVDKQQEVASLITYIDDWINKNLGSTADARAQLTKIPLVGAFTRFDAAIVKSLNKLAATDNSLDRTLTTALEDFKSHTWLNNWSLGKVFNQFFFVRRPNIPGVSSALYVVDENGVEKSLRSDRLDLIREYKNKIVSDDKFVHVYESNLHTDDLRKTPTVSEVLKPNDGGVKYLASFLKGFADFSDNKKRNYREIVAMSDKIRQSLGAYANEQGNRAASSAKKQALSFAKAFCQCDGLIGLFGQLRHFLELDEDTAIKTYLSLSGNGGDCSPSYAYELVKLWRLKLDAIASGSVFEKLCLDLENAWNIRQIDAARDLRRLGDMEAFSSFYNEEKHDFISTKAEIRSYLGELLKYWRDEMLKTATALKLEQALRLLLRPNESKVVTKTELSQGQAGRALRLISDFNIYLGTCFSQDPLKRIFQEKHPNRPAFGETFELVQHMPKLDDEIMLCFKDHLKNDYLSAFVNAVCSVNLQAQNRYGITLEQNERLCEILKLFDAGVKTGE